jgi:PAS domain S-box-containing protein
MIVDLHRKILQVLILFILLILFVHLGQAVQMVVSGLAGHTESDMLWSGPVTPARAEIRPPAPEPLIVGIPELSPPDYVSLDVTSSGFAMESMAHIAEAAGYSLVIRRYPDMNAVLQDLKAGRIQAIPLLPVREPYKQFADFTTPLRSDSVALFSLSNSALSSASSDLQGRNVGVVRGGIALSIVRELSGTLVREASGVEQLLFMLLSGQVDAVIHPQAAVLFYARRMGLQDRIRMQDGRLLQERYAIAVGKGNESVRIRLERQAELFVDSPSHRKLLAKWFAEDGEVRQPLSTEGVLALLGLLLVCGAAYWAYVYFRQVQQRRKAMLRSLLNASENAILLVSAGGDCFLGNETADRLFGEIKYGAGQSGFGVLFGEDDRERRLRAVSRVVETGAPMDTLHGHGDRIYRLSMHLIPRRNGADSLVAVTFHDVTERNAREQLVNEALRNFRLMFEGAPAGIAVLNSNMTVASANPALGRFLGCPARELEGQLLRDLLCPDDAESTRLELHKLFAGETNRIQVERRFMHKSGVPLWASLNVVAERSDAGLIESLMVHLTDIHERKTSVERLRESEQRYREIFERASDVILLINLSSGRVEEFNQAAVAVLGYSDTELEALDCSRLVVQGGEGDFAGLFDEGLAEGQLRRKDGSAMDVQAHTRILSAAGRRYALSIIRDVTGTREAEDCLIHARRAREQAEKATESFFGSIGEELRTPLQGMMGMLQLLAETPLTDLQQRYVHMSQESGDGLMRFMEDLLEYARLTSALSTEAGDTDLKDVASCPFVIDDMLLAVVNTYAPKAARKGGKLSASIASVFPEMLVGNAARLRKIVSKMVEYSVEGTTSATICLELRQPAGESALLKDGTRMTEFVVSVAADDLAEWAECARKVAGGEVRILQCMGSFGLALAGRFAVALGGSLSVEERGGMEERGRLVELAMRVPLRWNPVDRSAERVRTLAAQAVAEQTAEEDSPDRSGQISGADAAGEAARHSPLSREEVAPLLKGVRIIVADDDRINRVVIGRWLELFGGSVDYAEDGQGVASLLKNGRYDCLVLDLQMPGRNGLEVARAIRGGECGTEVSQMPIVALTAFSGKENEEACFAAGMNAFLSKPLDLRKLSEVLARLLESGRVLSPEETKAIFLAGGDNRLPRPN